MGLHAIPTDRTTGNFRHGAYLCGGDRNWEEVSRLLPRPEYAAEWKGVVFVVSSRSLSASPAHEVETWGANGLRAGPLVLFGDEELLRKVAAALAD
jgi:hypothetical protein